MGVFSGGACVRALAPFRGGKRLPSAETGLGGGVFVGAMRWNGTERIGTVSKGVGSRGVGPGAGRRALPPRLDANLPRHDQGLTFRR